MAMAIEDNERMTVASGIMTRINLMEVIIMETVITLEMVFKIGEIAECDTVSARNLYGIITIPVGFMLDPRAFCIPVDHDYCKLSGTATNHGTTGSFYGGGGHSRQKLFL